MNRKLSFVAVMSLQPLSLDAEEMVTSAFSDITKPVCACLYVVFICVWLMQAEIGIPALLKESLSAMKGYVFGLNSARTLCAHSLAWMCALCVCVCVYPHPSAVGSLISRVY